MCLLVIIPVAAQDGQPQYVSPAGKAYEARPDAQNQVAEAEKKLAADPKNATLILALGNAQAAIWRIREALATCNRGLELEPENALLIQSRGHRYLTLRELDRAEAELSRAARLDEKIPEAWYYLAIVHYVNRRWDAAIAAWEKRIALSKDYADSVGAKDWLYMTYRRAGRHEDAARLLEKVEKEQAVTGGAAIYQNRLLFYKGAKTEAELNAAMTDDVTTATLSYGLGNWYLYQAGNKEKAREYFEKSVASAAWVALAFIAAEKELGAGS